MNQKHLLGGSFVLVVLIAAGGYAAVVAPIAPVAPVSLETLEASPPASEGGVCSSNMLPVEPASPVFLGPKEAACSRCPDGTPQCWSDTQCDTFCGGPGFGDCVQINSCYRCCYCAL